MARDLDRLLRTRDNAHDGVIATTNSQAQTTLTWAQRLVAQAGSVVTG